MVHVRQRGTTDCGIAALAMLARVSYLKAAAVVPKVGRETGLYNQELVDAAAMLGLCLVPTRRYNLHRDCGILRVRWETPEAPRHGHYVAIRHGLAYCPKWPAQPCEDYLWSLQALPGTLLRVRERA